MNRTKLENTRIAYDAYVDLTFGSFEAFSGPAAGTPHNPGTAILRAMDWLERAGDPIDETDLGGEG